MKKKEKRSIWLRFDRVLANDLLKQLAILGIVLIVALSLSYALLAFSGAEWQKFCEEHRMSMWLLPLYLLIDSNAFSNLYFDNGVHGWMLFVSSLSFLCGAFIFNGIIIGVITNSIDTRVKNHQEGYIHYLKSGHYIIMGYDDMVTSIISHIFKKDKDAYILILTSAEAVSIREKLRKSFCDRWMSRIIINYGHRVSADAYRDICLEKAEQVYIVGNHLRSAHDAINVECVDCICRYLSRPEIKQRPERIVCVFRDTDTYAAFKTTEIFREVGKLGMEFVPYNLYSGWAKQVFVKRKYTDFDNPGVEYKYPGVYGNGITPDDCRKVHIVFVGITDFSVTFAIEAAHVMHFPNFNRDNRLKTQITFIDLNADKRKDEFIIRNRHFFEIQPYVYRDLSVEANPIPAGTGREFLHFEGADCGFLDVEFEFIKGDVFSKNIQKEISLWAEANDKQYLSIFLTLPDQYQNFVMGMNMPDVVYDDEIPIFILQDRSDNFVTNLRNADKRRSDDMLIYSTVNEEGQLEQKYRDARFANIYPFGMNETAYYADDYSLMRAKLINYLYTRADHKSLKFMDISVLDAMPSCQIWAEADEEWRKLTVALKWSNLYNAYTIHTKLATLRSMRGLNIEDISHDFDPLSDYEIVELAKVEHNRWIVEKLLMGFRKARESEDKYVHGDYADILKQNKNLFIHHDIRPYDSLDDIRVNDRELSRYIPWILKMTKDKV